MKPTRTRTIQRFGIFLAFVLTLGPSGCGGLSILLDTLEDGVTIVVERPEECFLEDIVDTDCFPQETLVTICEEDFFGFVECFDELIIELVCEDVIIDTFLTCD